MKDVCCGIVTYNPDLERLEENLTTIIPQVRKVFVYDNGSANVHKIIRRFSSDAVTVFDSGENSGMAVALNALARKAIDESYDYILLLDQDSVAPPNMVQELLRHSEPGIGIVAPQINDRNEPRLTQHEPVETDLWTINSGSLLSLMAYAQTEGYDERLFVDLVDLDFCLALQHKGFAIQRIDQPRLIHEIGKKELSPIIFPTRKQGGGIQWRHYRSNHSPSRRYDMARAHAILHRKYADEPLFKKTDSRLIKIWFTGLVTEKHRLDWIKQGVCGYREGLRIAAQSYLRL